MAAPITGGMASGYFTRLFHLVLSSLARLAGPALDPHAKDAARRFWLQALLLLGIGAVAVAALMLFVDFPEIKLMPKRGSPELWPARFLTDFGKAAFVIWTIGGLLVLTTLVAPAVREGLRPRLERLTGELLYVLLAVVLPILAGEVIKWIVGRGRPFVGPDPFTFSHFTESQAYASFPSAHSITSVALAFAVSALWPRWRVPTIVYALIIIATRLVLLAHHPSDVTAGAVIGVIGAMAVRTWFAARGIVFAIGHGGAILPPGRRP